MGKVTPKVTAPKPAPALSPPHLRELEELAMKLASGSSTLMDEERLRVIGRALVLGLPVPAKVVGGVANHRSGRGRIPQRSF